MPAAQQFVDAVSYCHEHNVAHRCAWAVPRLAGPARGGPQGRPPDVRCRDLKLDNTLMSDDKPPRIKLCDFGFAKEWQSDAQMFTHIG